MRHIPEHIGCLYLNNSGSRWVTSDMTFALYINGKFSRLRKADFYESFGNFASVHFRIGKVRHNKLFEDCEKHTANDGKDYPIIKIEVAK